MRMAILYFVEYYFIGSLFYNVIFWIFEVFLILLHVMFVILQLCSHCSACSIEY